MYYLRYYNNFIYFFIQGFVFLKFEFFVGTIYLFSIVKTYFGYDLFIFNLFYILHFSVNGK